jgi:transposase
MHKQKNKLDFADQNVYAGFDVHKKSWKVSILINDQYHRTFTQDPNPELLFGYLKKNFPGANYHTAYEAGFCGFWIHYALRSYGINSIVVNAADVPTTYKDIIQKEDARDSLKIAKALRGGSLRAIYVPTSKTCDDRALVRTRLTLTKDLARSKNRVKSFLNFQGILIPDELKFKSQTWSKNFVKWLESVTLGSSSGKEALSILIEESKNMRASKLKITRKIRDLSLTDAYKRNIELLRSVPGIGLITAMEILTELEDITRFKNMDHFASFIGLIPSTHSSGETENVGSITPRGQQTLRRAIVESSWVAVRNDPALTQKYIDLTKRMIPQRAIIRIAKKLLGRIFFVLKNKQPYQCLIVE